jgi:membrane-bound lytic murein transglycosylase D
MNRLVITVAALGYIGCAFATPLPPALAESVAGRRAVRGSEPLTAHESDELKAMRALDEEMAAPGAPLPDTASVPWLAELRAPDVPVKLEPRVVRYLELYKSDARGRAIMASWIKAQGRYKPLIDDALKRAKLPLALFYVSMIESGFDPHDRSHKGAVGLWQFMPDGGRIYGMRIDYWVDERKHPEKSTEAAMRYLGDLKERFGSWPLALAAFNAGYGAVLRAMQKYNTNDYWELCRHEDGLPWDTLLYVPKVLAAALVGENRKLFGYDELPATPEWQADRISVAASMSLTTIARASGAPVADIELLNPELRRKRTPPDVTRWEVRVPRGSGARTLAALEREPIKPYIVRFGDRLEDIAAAFGASHKELRALNGVDDSAEIRPGLMLVVPEGRAPLAHSASDTVIVAVPDKDAAVAGRKRVFYRTLPQDLPSEIATFFKVRPQDLARWNNLDLDAKLATNMVLQIWVAPDFDQKSVALVDPSLVRVVTTGSEEFFDLVEARKGRVRTTYVVKHGDDLKKIGSKFGLTPADLERINRFGQHTHPIHVGQKLTVYRAMTGAEKQKAEGKLKPGGTTVSLPDPPEEDPGIDDALPVKLPRPPPLELDSTKSR